MEEVSFKYRRKKLRFKAKKVGLFGRAIGLMFKKRENAEILLFEFEKPTKIAIHSLFVFFPFFAIWLDEKNRVVDVKRVNSFEFSVFPKRNFTKLVEIPINKKHFGVLKIISRR